MRGWWITRACVFFLKPQQDWLDRPAKSVDSILVLFICMSLDLVIIPGMLMYYIRSGCLFVNQFNPEVLTRVTAYLSPQSWLPCLFHVSSTPRCVLFPPPISHHFLCKYLYCWFWAYLCMVARSCQRCAWGSLYQGAAWSLMFLLLTTGFHVCNFWCTVSVRLWMCKDVWRLCSFLFLPPPPSFWRFSFSVCLSFVFHQKWIDMLQQKGTFIGCCR